MLHSSVAVGICGGVTSPGAAPPVWQAEHPPEIPVWLKIAPPKLTVFLWQVSHCAPVAR